MRLRVSIEVFVSLAFCVVRSVLSVLAFVRHRAYGCIMAWVVMISCIKTGGSHDMLSAVM